MRPASFIRTTIGAAVLGFFFIFGQTRPVTPAVAAGAHSDNSSATTEEKELSPEEKMNRRFPQPVRVGDLIGLPVLDWQDSTIGYVRQVVRTPDGRLKLIVPYAAWFGWADFGGIFDRARRPVAVPLETVAILARQIDVLDMPRKDFDTAPTFLKAKANSLGPDEMIKIAVTRR